MPAKKPASPKSSPEPKYLLDPATWADAEKQTLDRIDAIVRLPDDTRPSGADPATFAELLKIASDAGVIEFTAGPFSVKFSNAVAEHWRLMNRVAVDGKGRPV